MTLSNWRVGVCALIWVISTGVNADTVEVEIVGVEGEIFENVKSYITFFQKTVKLDDNLPILTKRQLPQIDLSVQQIQRAHRLAPQEIRQAVKPFGYYTPTTRPILRRTEKGWLARYEIALGPPTLVTDIELSVTGEGRDDDDIKTALSATGLAVGRRLSHRDYEITKKTLLESALASGYLDARFVRSEIRVQTEQHRAEITLILNTGPRFYFGPVVFDQTILRSNFIRRFLPFRTGDPFDSSQLINLQLSLEDTEYFSEVDIETQRQQTIDQHIPIVVHATPNKPRRYTAGAGFGTDTGPRISIGTHFRRVNRRGHRYRADLRVSAISSSIHSQYQVPIRHVTTDQLALTAAVTSEDVGDIATDQRLLGISRNEQWRGFQRQLYLNYAEEDFDIGVGNQTSEFVIPGGSLSRLVADDPLFPRKGFGLHLDLHGGLNSLGGETNFLQGFVSLRSVWPLGEKTRLLVRGEYGATNAGNFALLPPSQRLFAGGDRSVRGYGYQQLAPVNTDGDTIGGKFLVTSSIEVDYLIRGNYGAAVFLDAGNADDDPTPTLKKGTGVGMRYRSPIGMIRLDLAHPLDDDTGVRLHVSIGNEL
ncbi:MAG: outer membrane protein assembly factor [Gammaproteobacteria bacterium]|nr:outer membrane protein assembly factor [Gammaproteobacteria bacterium]MDH3466374.1 outer membrane protein assembly factor [Gammaproteobacteria bacterium]